MKCDVCGKPKQDKEDDFCYGCQHIICTDCCQDRIGDLIGWEHDFSTHRKEFLKKVENESWMSNDPKNKEEVEAK